MNHTDSSDRSDFNRRGILLMIASMVLFSIADSLVKVITSSLSAAQILFLLMGGALVIYTSIAVVQGENLIDRRAFSPVLLLRYLTEVVGMIGMINALALIPISTVGAVTQASPILAAVGAVIFLREQIGWRRCVCIALGFVGVLLIVQPGASEFDLNVLWAVLALVALSVRDLTTRLVPKDMSSIGLAAYTMAASTPVAAGWVLLRGEELLPAHINWVIVCPLILTGSLAYMLIIASLRVADVSVVMPFRYSRAVFLLVIGVLIFGERPNALMLIGALLIVASGIYMMRREQQVRRQQRSGPPEK